MIEGWGHGSGFGRPTNTCIALYKKDIEEGMITREEVRELLDLFYIKLNGLYSLWVAKCVRTFAGHRHTGQIYNGRHYQRRERCG